ncbi:amino acid permease 4-like [Cucurbita pepo subsp. pepo]|uniref:amino acid permease 4-like n=1 Tax=Cucurbita pepo subsp. pepo TaxID=3664 RepID=UPI000C9D930E|nr:amino acid permease 4-like [Cucurbita pepo subsp. pepo]
MAVLPINDAASFDDDGRPKRTGTFWTASAHIITAVIGSGVLSLAWAIAQLEWVAGPSVMLLFAFIGYYTSCLLADCYRSSDPVNGKRNYTYMHAVRSLLGRSQTTACGVLQYVNLIGISIGYTIASAISMMAVKRSNCFHSSGGKNPCHMSSNPFMVSFGVMEIILSQIPDFDQIWWLSSVAAVMSFTYSTIGLGLGIAKVAETGSFKGTVSGISVGTINQSQKIWRTFQALGDIAFAYSFSIILIEIQDTIRCPPSEAKTMKKATGFSIALTTIFYMLCGCMGYAAFGNDAPGNLLTGFGFYNPFWLLDIANIAIVVHLVGAYQVFSQPVFAFVEKKAAQAWPDSPFITKHHKLSISSSRSYNVNLFRLVWRSLFVCFTTVVAMLLPFFNDVVGIIGALQFWPLTVYFPVQMYIVQKKIPKWSLKWVCVQTMSMGCLLISFAAVVGSVIGVMLDLKVYKPFKTTY